MGMDQYLYIPFLGNEHPFTSYFDVHQGDRVLTHCHIGMDKAWAKWDGFLPGIKICGSERPGKYLTNTANT